MFRGLRSFVDSIFSLSRVALWRLLPQEYRVYISGSTGRESSKAEKSFGRQSGTIIPYLSLSIRKDVQYGIVLAHFGQQ